MSRSVSRRRLVFSLRSAITALAVLAFVATAGNVLAQATHRGPTAAGQPHPLALTDQEASGSASATQNGQYGAQSTKPAAAQTPGTQSAPAAQVMPMQRPNMPQRIPPNAELASKELNDRVEKLLKEMTLEEKAGQLAQYTGGIATGPVAGLPSYDAIVANGQTGSLFNVIGAKQTNHYQHIAMEKSRLKIPLIFGYDVIHGHRTEFPVPLALSATWDTSLVESTARMAAVEASADGIRWVFSPMVDISRDARWGRIVESAGEDPFLGSAMARAYVHGYQGKSLADPTSVAACVKHFAAYGAAEAGRDYNTADMSDFTLREVYLPPYKAAVDAGVATVMSAFDALNGVPSTANAFLMNRVLRREWGFQGFVVSDYTAIKELENHGIALDDQTAALKAISAGVDMDMMSNFYGPDLPELVKSGKLPPQVLDEAVRRVLRVKFALGLFDHPYTDENLPAYSATPEKRDLARKAAEESIILLKNQNGVLPLNKNIRSVALIGPLADSAPNMLGSWIAQGNPADAITLRAALAQRLQGRLTYVPGTDATNTSDAGFKDAVKAARGADAVIIALGQPADQTGEATSLAHLDLTGNQQQLLEAVSAAGKPVVLVLFNGHPLALTAAEPRANAIVEAWYPGIEAGNALSNLLFGDVNFSGKLTVSMPRSVGQEPLYYAQLPTGRPAGKTDLSHPPANSEEKYLSRYIDEQNTPLYPFGYGLSYTSFSFSQPTVSTPSLTIGKLMTRFGTPTDDRVVIGVDVKNTGAVAGTTVAQLYLRITGASTSQPVRMLRGFERLTLAPGESRHIDFKLGFDELSFVGIRGIQMLEPAHYDAYVGDSSLATEHTEFRIEPEPRPVPPKPTTPEVKPGTPGAAPAGTGYGSGYGATPAPAPATAPAAATPATATPSSNQPTVTLDGKPIPQDSTTK
jgi:beta-glucosidase